MGFEVLGTFRGAAGQMLAGITDICTRVVGGVVQVYTATRAGGGLVALELEGGGDGLALIDQQGIAAGAVLSAPGRMAVLQLDRGPVLIWTGGWASSPGGYALDDQGRIGAVVTLGGGPSGVMTAQAVATVGGTQFVLLAPASGGVVQVWRIDGAGRMALADDLLLGAAGQGFDVAALEVVRLGGASFVLALSAAEDALTVGRLRGDGGLEVTAKIGASGGLGIAAPSALEVVQVQGLTWVLVAGAGSSSISVLALDEKGGLRLTDHVIDTLDTRFQGISALATAVVGDRVFVFAAGGDQGVQAFVLMPDGRLVAAGLQLATGALALDNVTALEAVVRGGRIELILGCEGEGVIRLRYDPGDPAPQITGRSSDDTLAGDGRDDLIAGWGGNDSIDGGAGEDILFDGSGADTLRGGLGADVFVLAADQETDVILDFELGKDRLDLSGWGRIYAVEVLPMAERTGCVVIRWGDEALYVYTADGRNIDPDIFQSADFFGLWHVVAPAVEAGRQVEGTPQRETQSGGSGDDTLLGSAGDDLLDGGGGFDMVDYGAATGRVVADLADPAANAGLAAGDRYDGIEGLAGGRFGDGLRGDAGANRLEGRGGGDVLAGRGGDDQLDGGAGDDTLLGGAGADRLIGGTGRDWASYAQASGRMEVDLAQGLGLAGEALGDRLNGIEAVQGSRFNDLLRGDAGDNGLAGGGGADRLEGSDGDDRLSGGSGGDVLQGGNGDDLLLGGAGRDWASYEGRVGVRVDLALARAQETGGRGVDTLVSIENLLGGWQGDTLLGDAGANRINGGEGDDQLDGRGGRDVLEGGLGDDVITGGAGFDMALFRGTVAVRVDLALHGAQQTGWGRDVLGGIEGVVAGAGADVLAGSGLGNRLKGRAGADRLEGRAGDDTLAGGRDDDRLIGGAGEDRLKGGKGFDTVAYGGDRALTLSLSIIGAQDTPFGADVLRGIEAIESGGGDDRLAGSAAANRLAGGGGDDVLRGGGGADTLQGDAGADFLVAGEGADVLAGGAGDDALYGGAGADLFVFDGGRDRIGDFGAGDRIALDDAVLRQIAGMDAAGIVARWGVDLGGQVALDFGAAGRLVIEDIATLADLAGVIEIL